MISGCTCGSAYKVGTGFDFVVRQVQTGQVVGLLSFMGAKCQEIGAWYGTYYQYGYLSNNTAPGGVINISDSSGLYVKTNYTGGSDITITPCSFCDVTATISGSGSVSIGGTAYGKYRKAGDSITFTMTAAIGYKLKKLLVNGSTVTATEGSPTPAGNRTYTYTISSLSDDTALVAYFVPSQYTVTCGTPSGGTVAFTKNGVAATVPFTAEVDDVIVCTATPNSDKMVQNFVVDGYVTSGGSTGAQAFTFTIYEREDDATYNCAVTFADRTSVVDTVVGKSDGSVDDATVECNGEEVERDENGSFAAFIGNTYSATATEPTVFRSYGGWKNANGEIVSSEYSYSWTQGGSAVGIVAAYADKPLYTENFYVATSTSDYGTGGTAYAAGCRADIARPQGESKVVGDVTKYLGGTRTVSVHGSGSASDPLPANWTFSGVYVSDTDASGGTKFYKANGASSVTFVCACNANVYAIFANGAEVSPSDVDQGNSSMASGSAAQGLYVWEGASTAMTMKWHSKRFVASMPMNISTARVYADGYATGNTNDVKLKALMFQSPESSDSRVVETIAKSQDAYRTPMRRPEKYIELEVTAPHEVSQIAVATGMEALWQA